jgi:hypothetical protein
MPVSVPRNNSVSEADSEGSMALRGRVLMGIIYGLISLASMHEMADELDLSEHCFQQASDLAFRSFGEFWSEGWNVRECFRIFLNWTEFEYRHQRYDKALYVLDRWESWYKTCSDYTSVDGSPSLSSKETGMLSILALRAFVHKKLGNLDQAAIDHQGIQKLLAGMQDQQPQIESLRSFLSKVDESIKLDANPSL